MGLESRVSFRCTDETLSRFEEQCKNYDRDSADVHREMMDAFSEGKLTISVSKDKKTLMKGVHIVDRK